MNNAMMIAFILALTGTSVLVGPCILSLLIKKWRPEFPKVAIPFVVSLIAFITLALINTPNKAVDNQESIVGNNDVVTLPSIAMLENVEIEDTIPTIESPDDSSNHDSVTTSGEESSVIIYPSSVTDDSQKTSSVNDTSNNSTSEPEIVSNKSITEESVSKLEIYYIDVGQGDATLIVCDGEAMLIDLAKDKGSLMKKWLNDLGIQTLKYVIGTHPDDDHIGSLDVVFENYDCKTIIMPDLPVETYTHQKILNSISSMNYKITLPVVGDTYKLGGASFVILGPKGVYDNDNDNSVALRLVHGDNTFIFTGDAENKAEADFVSSGYDLSAKVMKVGHHGSNSSTSQEYLNAVNPQFAIISCGAGNSYGHPNEGTLERLRTAGCKVYRTDEQGTIIVTSDGKNLTFSCSPSETWLPGQVTESDNTSGGSSTSSDDSTTDGGSNTTVIDNTTNTSSRMVWIPTHGGTKYHSEKDCSGMNDPEYVTLEEAIERGFGPCSKCRAAYN